MIYDEDKDTTGVNSIMGQGASSLWIEEVKGAVMSMSDRMLMMLRMISM